MKKTLCLLTAVSALCMAAPVAAQYRDYRGSYGADNSFDVRIDNLRARLDAGLRAGTIDRREAWMLRRQLVDLERLEARYSVNGFSYAEREDLNRRLRAARRDVRIADNGSWDRYDRYADDDRWDRHNRYSDGDRWDRYSGRGGPEETVVCERRGGVIGLLQDVTGTRDCFVVGQRVNFELDPVPWRYRDMYRDTRDSYYRTDGRAIYEIDARTNAVIQVHRIPRD